MILDDIVGLNVKGNIRNISVRINSSLSESFSGLAQEEVDIRLLYGLRAIVQFANNTLHQIYLDDGDGPSYGGAKAFLERFQTYTGDLFYGELSSMLNNVTGDGDAKVIVGNVELEVHNSSPIIDYMWTYIDENGIRAPSKNVVLSYDGGGFKSFLNNWPFYTLATEPKISGEEAMAIALKELRNFSYGGVSKFRIATSGDPVSATITYSNSRDPSLARGGDSLILYPYWSVFMGFDRFYPNYITGASATGWADTGEAKSIGPTVLYVPGVTPEEIEDVVAPNITVSLLDSNMYNATNVSLSYEASEPVSWVDYSLDGQANVTITGNTTITGNLTLTGLSAGSHNLTIYAADAYGSTANIGASRTIYFTIAKPEILPTAIAVTVSAASLAVVAAGLLVYFKKRKR